MKIKPEKIVTLISVILIICLFAFFLKDILVPFIKLEAANDMDGAKELLRSKGILGFFAVALIEALQMVVIFIPAEFIQISSGLSYPLWLAVLLCDLGVCLGATIIYVLVRTFKFKNDTYEKKKKTIDALDKKNKKSKSTMLLLYFLFLMPLIPFGAICYYGSSTKLGYKKYILTVATGVIPSILTSNLMGTAAKAFIMNSIPLPLLILIIVALAAVLFLAIFFFLDRIYFKENDKTPDSVLYTAFFKFVHFFRKNSQRLHFENRELLSTTEGPCIYLCNHPSMFDFYYVKQFLGDINASIVSNKYYMTRPVIRKLHKKAGFISKKLFSTDLETIGGLIKMTRAGYSCVIFPEGRMSLDGTQNPIIENGGGLYKKLGVNVVILKIKGAYFSKPKWRDAFYKSDIYVSAERVISKDEAKDYTPNELDSIIADTLKYDDSAMPLNAYKKKNKAKGLEQVLYRCADCGGLYTTKSEGDDIICEKCGAKHTLDEKYRFDSDKIKTIHDYYEMIKEAERKELDNVKLEAAVNTKIFDINGKCRKKERGFCTLDKNEFSYKSDSVEFCISMEKLRALPFSVGEEFELYYKDEQYYFYPTENRRQVTRWGLIADIIYERNNEK